MRYSREQLETALVGARTLRDVMINLGMKVNGGNYRSVKAFYAKEGILIPSFVLRTKATPRPWKYSDEEYFVAGVRRNGSNTRERLIQLGEPYVCSECGLLPEWQGKSLTLHVDHIDGDNLNNLRTNLRFLCPNCHTQTETFGRSTRTYQRQYNHCSCGERISRQALQCRVCVLENPATPRPTRIDWPHVSDVIDLLRKTNFSAAGRSLGVSDNAIRKYLRSKGYDPKTLEKLNRV